MIKFKNLSITKKILIFSSTNIVLLGVILISFSYLLQSRILVDTMKSQASKITESWSKELKSEDVQAAKEAKDYDDPAQKKLADYFDMLSKYNPNVAQGYIFGTELKDGNKTSIIAFPSHVIKDFKEAKLNVGDMYEQPNQIAKCIETMLKTKEKTFSKVYKDDYGTWISILYPIQDKDGKIFSYFAIDVDASAIPDGQRKLVIYSLIALIVFLALVLLIQYVFVKKTLSPLKELVHGIDKVSQGDFNFKLKTGSDELGVVNNKFNLMADQITEMLLKVKETSYNIDEFSKALLAVAEENNEHTVKITRDISEMASNIETQEQCTVESANAINEIAVGVQVIANNASNVSYSAVNMENQSTKGNDVVEKVMKQMKLISNAVQNTASVIKALDGRSKEIGMITEVMTQISSQTDLLALNAAIEAARAGEHGRGFAVVADEVRKLAEQSKKSAEQIVKVIQIIQNETSNAVNSMDTGNKEVEIGMEIAKQTGDLFLEILNTTKAVTLQIQDVSGSSEQISATTEEITATVTNLITVAKQTSSTSNNIASNVGLQQASMESIVDASKKLSFMSEELQRLISKFQV